MDKIKGWLTDPNSVHIGDKHLTTSNVEDISSYRIFIVDDIFEISLRIYGYECTKIQFKYKGKITKFQN